MLKKLTIFLLFFFISSCSQSKLLKIKGKDSINLKEISYANLPGWNNDNHQDALLAFSHSCSQIALMSRKREIGNKIGHITPKDFRNVCDIANVTLGMNSLQAKQFFQNWFIPFKVQTKNRKSTGKFTGYYVPTIEGSFEKNDIYKYPIYKNPKNIINNYKYYSRRNIEQDNILKNKNLELLYVKSKVDLFFLQIQGSGRIITPKNIIVKINFDGKNSYPYTSIMKYMLENNIVPEEQKSYQNLKKWLQNNPEQAEKIMHLNASYVFFKTTNKEYAVGSSKTPMTKERSLAIDDEIMPYGFPIWIDTFHQNNPYQKLFITQDTGAAIKGTIRGDIFFGYDKQAEKKAINMNSEGSYYILIPKATAQRLIRKNREEEYF